MQRARRSPRLTAIALTSVAALALTGCGAAGTGAASSASSAASGAASSASSAAGSAASTGASSSAAQDGTGVAAGVTVTDMAGTEVTLPAEVDSVIATDNRVFRTLDEWGVELTAAPKQLMYKGEGGPSYLTDDAVADIGNHREPDMEVFVTAEPDVVFTGQRFNERKAEIEELTGEAAVVDTNFDAAQVRVDEGLTKLTTLLGEATGHQADAEKLNADFDAAVQEAKDAYDPEQTVMGLIATGGDLSYVAPGTGRSIGPVFDILGLTPALEQAGSDNHQGDDISVEAIAASNPDWLIVMDRDAAVGEENATAKELIERSEALKDVTAVKEGNIVYLPQDFYVAEDIQNYTTLMKDLASAFQGAR